MSAGRNRSSVRPMRHARTIATYGLPDVETKRRVGRVREDPLMHLKFVVLSHNTIRGAAGGSLYNAELLVNEGLL